MSQQLHLLSALPIRTRTPCTVAARRSTQKRAHRPVLRRGHSLSVPACLAILCRRLLSSSIFSTSAARLAELSNVLSDLPKNPFSKKSKRDNFAEVMGQNSSSWFLPTHPKFYKLKDDQFKYQQQEDIYDKI